MQVPVQEVWGRARDSVFLKSYRGILLLLAREAYLDLITNITAIIVLSPVNSLSVHKVTGTLKKMLPDILSTNFHCNPMR